MIVGPNSAELFTIASSQAGHFTAKQAHEAGYSPRLLQYHTDTGRFIRLRRGLYRLRDYPSSPREEVMAAWLAVGKEDAVVSYESALDLLGLSDVIPDAIHLTVPRSRRHLPMLPGVVIHTTTRAFRPEDVVVRDGMRVTSPVRTILDTTETGTGPEQVKMAIDEAIERGMATKRKLDEAAAARPQRVSRLIHSMLNHMAA